MAVKRLLRQTLSHDDEVIDVHPLAELILSEGVRLGAGSSIKTDGEESDPWGLVGVVDIAKHRVSPPTCPSLLSKYLVTRVEKSRGIVINQERLDGYFQTTGSIVRSVLMNRKTQL